MKTITKRLSLATLCSAAVLLAACGSDDQTVGQKVDSAISESRVQMNEAKDKVAEAGDTVERKAESAGDFIERKADAAGRTVSGALSDAGQVVEDAAITTAVKAELIRADDVDALKIDVDTRDGEVTLSGTAPSDAAREKAESLAEKVDGVKEVHNKLALATQ
ncbi:MAG: BON domain-containing protein [Rhodocyclaceae bacterium]|nr:BON domain-containing protein [Rhodocyclaceae bacterium]